MADSKTTNSVQVKPFGIQVLESVPAQEVQMKVRTGVNAGRALHSQDIVESKGAKHTLT